jgi:hypothetical protein
MSRIKPHVFVPIIDPEGYVNSLRATGHETDEEVLKQILEKHMALLPEPKNENLREVLIPTCENPNAEAAKYYAKGKFPPISVRIRCAAKRGVSQESLLRSLARHERDVKNSDKNQKILDDIFDKYCGIKPKKLKPVIKHAPVF